MKCVDLLARRKICQSIKFHNILIIFYIKLLIFKVPATEGVSDKNIDIFLLQILPHKLLNIFFFFLHKPFHFIFFKVDLQLICQFVVQFEIGPSCQLPWRREVQHNFLDDSLHQFFSGYGCHAGLCGVLRSVGFAWSAFNATVARKVCY